MEPATARVWLPLQDRGPHWALSYLIALDTVIPVRAISFTMGDFPDGGPWAPWGHLFVRPLGNLQWNIVVGADETTRVRLYTDKLINIAVVRRVRPVEMRELARWKVWTSEEWTLADYYVNACWVPPERHAVANALTGTQVELWGHEEVR